MDDHRVRIRDIADDTHMCEMVSPALTSMKQDVSMRAEIAVKKLRELKEKEATETTIRLPVQLIERESTCRTVR